MHVIIVANGSMDYSSYSRDIMSDVCCVIAADGGANHCIELGIQPNILIGDMDSVQPEVKKAFKTFNVGFVVHPEKKNATDLELALDLAKEKGASSITLLGVLGGRWDMTISTLLLMGMEKYKNLAITILHDSGTISLLREGVHNRVAGEIGETISLLPLKGDVEGVTLKGFEYPLRDETLPFGSSKGLSNILIEKEAQVDIKAGMLLCSKTTNQ